MANCGAICVCAHEQYVQRTLTFTALHAHLLFKGTLPIAAFVVLHLYQTAQALVL